MAKRVNTNAPTAVPVTKLDDHPGFVAAKSRQRELTQQLRELDEQIGDVEGQLAPNAFADGGDLAVAVQANVEVETQLHGLRRTKSAVERSLAAAADEISEQQRLARKAVAATLRPEYESMVARYCKALGEAVELQRELVLFASNAQQAGINLPAVPFSQLRNADQTFPRWKEQMQEAELIQATPPAARPKKRTTREPELELDKLKERVNIHNSNVADVRQFERSLSETRDHETEVKRQSVKLYRKQLTEDGKQLQKLIASRRRKCDLTVNLP